MRFLERIGDKLIERKKTSSAKAPIIFVVLVLLILFAFWAVARESRKAVQQLGLWAISIERTRKLGKYLYLFALLVLVVRAFKGLGGVLKFLAAFICLPGLLVGGKLRELLRRNGRSNPEADSQPASGSGRAVPLLARWVFFFVEKRNREHLVGDLEEEYWTLIIPVRGWFHARCWWWGEALGIITAYLWKRVRRTVGRAAVPVASIQNSRRR